MFFNSYTFLLMSVYCLSLISNIEFVFKYISNDVPELSHVKNNLLVFPTTGVFCVSVYGLKFYIYNVLTSKYDI